MTVADMQERMTWDEYLGWNAFFTEQARATPSNPSKGPNLLEMNTAALAAKFKGD
jgi:hypothetical protein